MEEYFVDLSGVPDRAALHLRLREGLSLPSWYGNNLDALYDVLTDMRTPAELHFYGWEDLQEVMPGYFDRFRRVLTDVQEDLPGFRVFFEPVPAGGRRDEDERTEDADPDGYPWLL
ncbi:MAG: barstar family protein [Eubacteriales bacterium]|nr:barstar family protein [Eubacteriales bacterium]